MSDIAQVLTAVPAVIAVIVRSIVGSYENTEAQARGEVVWPTLE